MTVLCFVDSNLLVYRHDRDKPLRQARAQEVLRVLWERRAGRVSVQVLHEFYVVATRKLATPVATDIARDEVRQLQAWKPLVPTQPVREAAWRVEDRYALSWWDALIVAAAFESRCELLLTEDLQDGQVLHDEQATHPLHVVNPFDSELEPLGIPAPQGR